MLLGTYAVLMLFTRVYMTKTFFMGFLIWNLFLAFVPYFTMLYIEEEQFSFNKIKTLCLLFIWLIFLPNSFYIVTDLVHLTKSEKPIIWLDIPLVSLFTISGFVLGLESIRLFEEKITAYFSKYVIDIFVLLLCISCGFGIFIGRILRFNSWDILQKPLHLLGDILTKVFTPSAILFSIHFGIFIYIIYTSKKLIKTF